MRTSQSFLLCTAFLLCLCTFTSAWPWPNFLPEIDSLIVRRADDNNNDSSASSSPTASGGSAKSTGDAKSDSDSASASGSGSASDSNSDKSTTTKKPTGKSSSKASKTTAAKHTSYDARLPAGGIHMITPAATAVAQYYKIGDNVTFAWNYTSLSSTPSALNVYATCTANQQLYTLAANQTLNHNATGAVTWDTATYSTAAVELLTETYTLIIFDADSSISAPPEAGYLAPFDSMSFGMYVPQAYTPLADGFQCATCSAALSDMERRALGFMGVMFGITVLSFTWFMGGLNIIW